MNMWYEQNAFGKEGEWLAVQFYKSTGCTITDVSNDKEYQVIDVDFIAEREGTQALIEVKNDRVVSRTGNLFLEINTDKGTSNSLGWFRYSKADILFYIDSKNAIGYEIRMEELRKFVEGHSPRVPTRTLTDDFGDFVKIREGYCLPLREIEDKEWVRTHSLRGITYGIY